MDFDFQKLPLPIHLINSPYLEHALSFLKIEKKRLKRLTYLSHSKLIRKIFSICFWLFMIELQNKTDYNNHAKHQLLELLKKKHFSMILKIRKPKEQIFEILPFFISKAILIAIEDKIIEKISLIMSNDSSEHHIMRICSFVFQQINGMKLSDSAITKLIRQFLEVEKEREGNVRIVQMSNQEFKEIDGMNKDSPERQRLEDSDQDINYNQIQMQHNYHDLESIVSRQLQKAKSIRRLRTSEKSDRPVPNTGYQKQRYSLKEKALNQVTKNDAKLSQMFSLIFLNQQNDEEVSPNQESKQQHDLRQNLDKIFKRNLKKSIQQQSSLKLSVLNPLTSLKYKRKSTDDLAFKNNINRQNKVNNQDQNIENFKDEDEKQNIQIVPLKKKKIIFQYFISNFQFLSQKLQLISDMFKEQIQRLQNFRQYAECL